MTSAFESLLQHPAIWRGGQLSGVASASLPSGFPALDAELPGGGWPTAAVTEILPQHEGIGELRVLGPALAALAAQGRTLLWIAPPHTPYAPALAAAGIDLARLIVVRTQTARETLWATEQALRSRACGAVLAWPAQIAYPDLRRLQLAAEGQAVFAALFRPQHCSREATPAALRIALHTHDGGLAVRILKRRGSSLAAPIILRPAPIVRRRLPRLDRHVMDSRAPALPAARSVSIATVC